MCINDVIINTEKLKIWLHTVDGFTHYSAF